jgi:hypothetical protein
MGETMKCARGALLETWSGHHWRDGIQLETLHDLTKLSVQTENNSYEITVISAFSGEILVRGGKFFPEYTPARLAGSSLGGSFLKVRGIYAGFNLELFSDGRTIITSRVRTIALEN